MDVVDAAARDLWVPGPEVSSAHRRQRWPGSNAQSLSGTHRVGKQAWEAWDEPYKVSYREYVHNQVTKDTTTYSLKNAISRSKVFEQLDPGWKSVILAHYGAITMPEYLASIGEARMGRFGRAAAWRNTATFGTLDEVRHGQIQAFFPYGLLPKEPRGDWALKAFHTDNWIILAVRHLFDDMFVANDALSVAIQLTFMLETGFTNLQFLGMAADAIDVGDLEFGALISSIQTDEARHAQQGEPTKVLIDNGHKEYGQFLIDHMFWRSWRAFALLTGLSMDYYTPLEARKMSFKEFIQDWVVKQFAEQFRDYGLTFPGTGTSSLTSWTGTTTHPHHHLELPPASGGTPMLASPRRAGVAGGEVPRLEPRLRQALGRPHAERPRRQASRDLSRDAAGRLQHLPAPGRPRCGPAGRREHRPRLAAVRARGRAR